MKFPSICLQITVVILQYSLFATSVIVRADFVGMPSQSRATVYGVSFFQQYRSFEMLRKSTVTYRISIRRGILPVQLVNVRGGWIDGGCGDSTTAKLHAIGTAPAIFDMDRMKLRLDGLSQYAVICALLVNVCLNIYFNTMKYLDVPQGISPSGGNTGTKTAQPKSTSTAQLRLEKVGERAMKMVKVVFILSSVFSILSSAYTAIVFTLLGLYSKAALGMGCDSNFVQFFDATHQLRQSAFDSFVASLVNFELSFLSSLIIAYKGQYRLSVIVVTALCLTYSCYHWFSIIAIAGKLLYSSSTPTSIS